MTSGITMSDAVQRIDEESEGLFDSWLDPLEIALRERVRGFIETLIGTNWKECWRARATDGGLAPACVV